VFDIITLRDGRLAVYPFAVGPLRHLTLKTGVVTYCVFVVFSVALLKSGLTIYADILSGGSSSSGNGQT
jgi:hypothetical protein